MKIEQHEVAIQTQYASKESVLSAKSTFSSLSDEWESSMHEEGEIIQETDPIEYAQSLQEMLQKMQCSLINDLLNLFNHAQPSQSFSSDMAHLIPMTKENELEFKRLGIPLTKLTYTQEREVSEDLNTRIEGKVCTSDGREIPLHVNMNLSQSFQQKVQFSQTVFTDPLIVNLDGTLPTLEEATFSFDIDCDGESDQISRLAEGNGFLALDKNENGTIDDGSELFGAESGDGFCELSEYDSDSNQWIDEGDAIYDQLRIWTNNGKESHLTALGESGIGAIYLGSGESDFTYRGADGQALGALRNTGMFLYENGEAGNISQIDLARHSDKDEPQGLQKALKTRTT